MALQDALAAVHAEKLVQKGKKGKKGGVPQASKRGRGAPPAYVKGGKQ